MPDNFTSTLRGYYAYRQVAASDARMVLEFGELTCPRQRAWLASHLDLLSQLVARFIEGRIVR